MLMDNLFDKLKFQKLMNTEKNYYIVYRKWKTEYQSRHCNVNIKLGKMYTARPKKEWTS